MDRSNLLIDFSSPVQKQDVIPLIPVPPQISLASREIVEPSDDPFEVKILEARDPFDSVLQSAFSGSNSAEIAAENFRLSASSLDEKSKNDCSDGAKTSNVQNSETNSVSVSSPPNDNVLKQMPIELNQANSRNEIPKECKADLENPHVTLANNNAEDALKNLSKSSAAQDNNSQSQLSADFSTEENLKAVIAKRVNRCIQDVLNGSLKTNKNGNNSVFKKPQNKRSLSFIGLSTKSDKNECDRLNKSCTDVNDVFNLENQQPDTSSGSSGFGLLSPNSTDVSAEGNVEDQVFKEARKLSRKFSRLAESFHQEEESGSDDEDLMTCKPRWLYTDSSEDEEDKLLRDPALNFRRRSDSSAFNSPAPQPPRGIDSPALLAYKSRRSLTHLQTATNNTQVELQLKRSVSVGSQLKEAPVFQATAAIVPINLMKTDDQPMKLRKKNFGDVKKGPLKAVMPVQSMTKELLPVAGKQSSKQETSPEGRIQKSVYTVGTPNKDNSHLNITPMASSTPNKAESFVSSKENASLLMKPVAPVAGNKRHSLEGNFGGHKSRGAVSEVGTRPRSNSANSSIPRVMQVRPLVGLPKSTSNLIRTAHTQINTNNVKIIPEKKNTSHLKSSINSRVLAEVKTKSPRQSKVRTAVNTISKLVRGKKTAAQDKENRVPA